VFGLCSFDMGMEVHLAAALVLRMVNSSSLHLSRLMSSNLFTYSSALRCRLFYLHVCNPPPPFIFSFLSLSLSLFFFFFRRKRQTPLVYVLTPRRADRRDVGSFFLPQPPLGAPYLNYSLEERKRERERESVDLLF
jgi:hypothetical protein